VPGLGGGERERDGLQVAHLADQDHVRVLAQRAAQRVGERPGVRADLALVDEAALGRVHELDRILDRQDVRVPGLVDDVDHRRKGGRLAGARRPGHQDEPALARAELLQDGRHVERLERGDQSRDGAQHRPRPAAVQEDVDAEAPLAGQLAGEVDLVLAAELRALDGRS